MSLDAPPLAIRTRPQRAAAAWKGNRRALARILSDASPPRLPGFHSRGPLSWFQNPLLDEFVGHFIVEKLHVPVKQTSRPSLRKWSQILFFKIPHNQLRSEDLPRNLSAVRTAARKVSLDEVPSSRLGKLSDKSDRRAHAHILASSRLTKLQTRSKSCGGHRVLVKTHTL